MTVWVEYDGLADAVYVRLVSVVRPGEATKTCSVAPSDENGLVNVDFDSSGRMLGIEVLDAASRLASEVLAGRGIRVSLDGGADVARIELGLREPSPLRLVPFLESPDSGGIWFEYASSGRIVGLVVQDASRRLRRELLASLGRDAH